MLATRICCNVFGVLGLILNRILSVSYKGTIDIGDIKVSQRLRPIDQKKVDYRSSQS